jgi:uncharacterized protein (DUF362 family)/ferredoxin
MTRTAEHANASAASTVAPAVRTIYVRRCANYDRAVITPVVRALLDAGGMGDRVSAGATVLVKPNLMSAREPDRAVTTHPAVTRAVVAYFGEKDCRVLLGDSPSGALKGVRRVWNNTGTAAVAAETGAELVNFESYGSVRRAVGGRFIRGIYVTKAVEEADVVVSVAKLKTHSLTVMSGAVKNLFGLVPGLAKAELHRKAPHPADFGELLVDLLPVLRPSYTVVDAVVGMAGDGPASGDLYPFGFVAGGADPAQLDVFLAGCLGMKPGDVDSVRVSLERGLVSRDFELEGDVLAGELEGRGVPRPKGRWIRRVPKPVLRAVGQTATLQPVVDRRKCTACGSCVRSCPVEAVKFVYGRAVINTRKCIQCLCCHETCSYEAIPLRGSTAVNAYFALRDWRRRRRARRR